MSAFQYSSRFFWFLMLAAVPAQAQAAEKTYAELVAQAESGDLATDFTALRMAYVKSDGYDGYNNKYHDLYQPLWKAALAKDCNKVIAISDEALKSDYTLVSVHMARATCFKEMGDQARAEHEDAVGHGLAHSVFGSGDGKSTATAYIVITMDEEHLVEGNLHLDGDKQSLINEGGHSYDLIEGPNRDTHERIAVYFNVDAMFGSLMKIFGGKHDGAQN